MKTDTKLLPIALLIPRLLAVKVFPSPAALPATIPLSCRTTLSSDVNCSPTFVGARDVLLTTPFDDAFLNQYCVDSCKTALQAFQTKVSTQCGTKKYEFSPGMEQSGSDIANALIWAWNVTCVRGTSPPGFCLSKMLAGSIGTCDSCVLKYEAAIVSSPFGDRLMTPQEFAQTLSSCKVPSSSYPIPTRGTTTTPTSSTPLTTPTCDSKSYTVKQGDTCNSIAKANSIGQDLLIARNKLDYNCATMATGDILCLGDTCTLHVVAKNETCDAILSGLQSVTLQELRSWNPTIHYDCDNLDAMVGRPICVSPPGSTWDVTGDDLTTVPINIFSPYVMPTSKMIEIPGAPSVIANFTTRFWAVPSISTRTRTADPSRYSALQQRRKFCPDFEASGVYYAQLPDDCQKKWDPYCFPTILTGSILPSPTGIPSSCSPAFYVTPTASSTMNA